MVLLRKVIKYCNFLILLAFLPLLQGCAKDVYVEPKENLKVDNARLFVDSSPRGAIIYINGKTTGLITPDTVKWLDTGAVSVTLRKKLFWDTTFTVVNEKNTAKNIFIDYYKSDRMLASIICFSNPAGSKIYLNGVYTGRTTPDTLRKLIPDTYKIKYSHPEYRDDSVNVTVQSMGVELASIVLDDTLDVISYNIKNSGIPSQLITGMGEDKNGFIWAGTADKGLLRFDGNKFNNYTAENSSFVPSNYVKKLKSDRDGNIWTGFSNALSNYDGSNWSSIQSDAIFNLQVTLDNTILASTERRGIIKYSGGQYSYFTTSSIGMPSNEVTSMTYDKDGKFWIALRAGGLAVYDGSSWTKLDSIHNGLPYAQCYGLAQMNDGTLIGIFSKWVPPGPQAPPTSLHVIAKYVNGSWITINFAVKSWLEDRDLIVDAKNRIWYSFEDIARIPARISPGSYYPEYFVNYILKLNSIRKFKNKLYQEIEYFCSGDQIFIDSKGNLWIFGNNGMIKIKPGRWIN